MANTRHASCTQIIFEQAGKAADRTSPSRCGAVAVLRRTRHPEQRAEWAENHHAPREAIGH